MEQVNFYPLIAGLVGSNSRMVGESLHFLFAVIIGVSFAFLFQREARGYGSSMACGMAYGIFWWFLGPLTILPLWSRRPLDWSSNHASELFGSLIGHIVYGVIVGLLYAAVDRLWVRFFTESDPIRRQPEGPGVRFIRLIAMGRGFRRCRGCAVRTCAHCHRVLEGDCCGSRRNVADIGLRRPSRHQHFDGRELRPAVSA